MQIGPRKVAQWQSTWVACSRPTLVSVPSSTRKNIMHMNHKHTPWRAIIKWNTIIISTHIDQQHLITSPRTAVGPFYSLSTSVATALTFNSRDQSVLTLNIEVCTCIQNKIFYDCFLLLLLSFSQYCLWDRSLPMSVDGVWVPHLFCFELLHPSS